MNHLYFSAYDMCTENTMPCNKQQLNARNQATIMATKIDGTETATNCTILIKSNDKHFNSILLFFIYHLPVSLCLFHHSYVFLNKKKNTTKSL